jgi:hypothetical protein
MVKKTLLSLTIAASMAGLTACNISSTGENNTVAKDPVLAGQPGQAPTTVSPLFNPARGQLPLATDFLFGFPSNTDGTPTYPTDADGTLYHASAYTTNSDGDRVLIGPTDEGYNPVLNALNEMDGVSINAEIDIPVSGNVDASTVLAGKNLILLPLNYVDPVLFPDSLDTASPFLAEHTDFTVSTIQYATAAGEASKYALRVNLTKPLTSKTRYLVIIANNGDESIKDTAGNNMVMPGHYRSLASDDDLLSAALAPARTLVQSWSGNAKGYLAVKQQDSEGLIMAYTFTTGGGIEVLSSMAAPGNANADLKQTPALRAIVAAAPDAATAFATLNGMVIDAEGTALTAAQAQGIIALATSLETPGPRTVSLPAAAADLDSTPDGQLGLNIANFIPSLANTTLTNVVTGTIELPYYLAAPSGAYTGENPAADTGYLCTATADNLAECIAGKTSVGNTIISQWAADDSLATDLQKTALTPPSTNVTRLFPFAKKNGMRKAPVLVVKPSTAEPVDGYPVIIYQHGIFGDRTDSLLVANKMAAEGFVTVAIDLPLHGVMPTDLISGTTSPIFASLLGAQGVNLAAMDTETQAATVGGATVAERHFGLTDDGTFTPTGASSTDADKNKSGSLFFNLIHLQTARDNLRQAVMDLLNLNASLASFDIDGDSDAKDIDISKVHYIGHSLGGIVGTTFVATNNLNGLTVIGDGPTYLNPNGNGALPLIKSSVFGMPGSAIPRLLEASTNFGPTIKTPITTPTANGGFGLTENSESYNQLFYVFQGSLDSADPASFAQAMSQIPGAISKYMVIESIGDKTVPNSATSPLAGTNPLAALLGTSQIDGDTADFSTGKYFVKFNDADSSHSSLASPGVNDVEAESFSEIMSLTAELFKGNDPAITNSSVISATAAE